MAVAVGLAQGLISYFLGDDIGLTATIYRSSALYVFLGLFGHLQHSQVWIPVTGLAGRIIYSPAHHQIHHSTDPTHYNKNLGLSLAVFDWLFGTLHIPKKREKKLIFGVSGGLDLQNFSQSIVFPLFPAWEHIKKGVSYTLEWSRLVLWPSSETDKASKKTFGKLSEDHGRKERTSL